MIAAFDVIPTEEPYDEWFGFGETNQPMSINFEATGYESMYYIRNLGSVSLVYLYFVFYLLLLGILKVCVDDKLCPKLRDLRQKLYL